MGVSSETKTAYIHDKYFSARFDDKGKLHFALRHVTDDGIKGEWVPMPAHFAIKQSGLFTDIIATQKANIEAALHFGQESAIKLK